MATLKEIAETTGFSITTISRVLNEDHSFRVSDETRYAVLRVAEEMNYRVKSRRPDGDRAIRDEKKVFYIGVVEMKDRVRQMQDTYYLYMKSHAERSCFARNMETTSLHFNEHTQAYECALEHLDGILAIGQFLPEQIAAMEQWTDRIVFLDSSPKDEKYCSILPNYETGVRQGLENLIQNGHRRIAYAGVKYTIGSVSEDKLEYRWKLFDEIVAEYKPQLCCCHIDVTERPEEIREAAIEFLEREKNRKEKATAFFAFNETTAMGILNAVKELGYHVPQDYSIMSYNDTVLATYTDPPLTGIRILMEDMADIAASYLRRFIEGKIQVPIKILVPTKLSVRGSVAMHG